MKLLKLITYFTLLMMAILPISVCAQTASEYEIKAAFLYNFALYSTWSKDANQQNTPEVLFCVIGYDPFGNALDALVGRKIKNKKVAVLKELSLERIPLCQLLYISRSEQHRLMIITQALAGSNTLTVSDFQTANSPNTMIDMKVQGGKIVFDVDLKQASQAGIEFSSKLLNLAQQVYH